MTISELKEYIFKNNKIEYILESLGCHNIKHNEKHDYISASFPDGDNPQGINIRNNEYLNYRSFSRNVSYEDGKDIISLVEYITKKSFIEAIKYLHGVLNLEYKWQKKQEKPKDKNKYDPLEIFKKIKRAKKKVDVEDIHVLDEEVLDEYIPLLHIDWLKQGIMSWTAKKFGLAYSYKRKRVIIPMRAWNTGELLGINARTTIENWEELGIKKYFISPTYQKHLNLFGLYENYDAIQKAGYVVVYEAEKSVLKRDSLCDSTGVALSGHSMSEEQARILIGIDVNEIVIVLDKDVPVEEVWHMCEKFYNIRKVSYIWDSWGLLGEKDSPADASNKIYSFLFKYRVVYDAEKHNKYLKSLGNK